MNPKITRSTTKHEILKLSKIECKECTHCCEYGSGIVLKEEVKELAKRFKITKDKFIKDYLVEFKNFNTTHYKFKTKKTDESKPYGKCILLKNKNGCSIHDIKPLHCRIGSCNEYGEEINIWFTTNHFVNEYDPESIRQWASYLKLGNKTIGGCQLTDLIKDKKTLDKILKYKIME